MAVPYLTLVGDYLESEDMDARLVRATDAQPLDQLVVPIPRDDEQGDWEVTVLQLPDMEDDIEGASAVQFFVPLGITAGPDASARGELARLLAQINNLLALIGFSYREIDGGVVFRHMAIIPDSPAAWTTTVHETVFLAVYHIEQFIEPITAVAEGRASFEQAARESGDPRLAASVE